MKKYKNILFFLFLFLYNFIVCFYSISNNDLIWNYGFCYNFAKGLKMYKDFNMVITPLFPTIFGLIMKLFGNNMVIFYLSNAIIPTIIFYLVYKYYRKVLVEVILLVSFVSSPNYNLLCLLFLFILFVLEDKKSNDYLIGFVLGLTFLTKSSIGILSLASLYYYKDIKKIFKRIIGFLLPNIFFIIYFYINKSLFDYFNYAFLSLFDFASNNSRFNIFGILVFVISIIFLVYIFRKKRDIKILYILCFQIMSYPIFNMMHILMSFIPLMFYILLMLENNFYNKYKKILIIFLICPLLSVIFQNMVLDLKYGTNALKYKKIEAKYYNDAYKIKDEVKNLSNVYFNMYEAYYYKLLLGLDINKYDLLLTGNLGYNGEDKVLKYYDSLAEGTQFIMYNTFEEGQASKKIYNYIKDNYKVVKIFDKFVLYEK